MNFTVCKLQLSKDGFRIDQNGQQFEQTVF